MSEQYFELNIFFFISYKVSTDCTSYQGCRQEFSQARPTYHRQQQNAPPLPPHSIPQHSGKTTVLPVFLSKLGVHLQILSTKVGSASKYLSSTKRGLPSRLHQLKGIYLQISLIKGGPPLDFINQTGLASRIHQHTAPNGQFFLTVRCCTYSPKQQTRLLFNFVHKHHISPL